MKSIIYKSTIILLTLFLFSCEKKPVPEDQTARLNFILGDVTIDNLPCKIGQILNKHSFVTTGEESTAEIKIGSGSGIQIRENSKAEIVNDENGWNVISHKGAILSLLQKGTRYKIKSPAAVMAVRGTIFYIHTYEDSTEYICTCNGTIDILHNEQITKTVSASHHEGYTASKTETGQDLKEAPMKEHTDLEIFEFMYRLENSRY
jgi:hypothetical protein